MQTHANQYKARDVTYLTDFQPLKTRDAKHLMFSVLPLESFLYAEIFSKKIFR
jgi:hypothetical protein